MKNGKVVLIGKARDFDSHQMSVLLTGRCKEGNDACEATKAAVLETMEDICQEIKSLGIVLVRDEERALAFKGSKSSKQKTDAMMLF